LLEAMRGIQTAAAALALVSCTPHAQDRAGADAATPTAPDASSPIAPADGAADAGSGSAMPPPPEGSPDPTGFGDSVLGSASSSLFSTSLGTNGRSCATCHVQAEGWSVTPADVQARFQATAGTDPIFRTVDGTNSPHADVSTLAAMQASYSMLLSRAVLRIGIGMPTGADFTLAAVDDPYGFASAAELSLFRRPLPATNLRFLTSIMWDGREASLTSQASDATQGHAQATSIDPDQMAAIVEYESEISTAQSYDNAAGALDGSGATGGPLALSQIATTPSSGPVLALYAAWNGSPSPAQASIARGEQIFETRAFAISGVAGIADQQGTCATCHDNPAAGGNTAAMYAATGVAAASRRTPDLPLYTFARSSDGATVQTTDPGLALITGAFADMSKFKVPTLRALAMRAPYFHDGSAATLAAVVAFYEQRFAIGLTAQDQTDLVAFLQAI
jgi:cytochrome c peroxidase